MDVTFALPFSHPSTSIFFFSVARSTPEVTLSDDSDMETESPFIEEDFGAYRGARQSALIPDE